jgi:8-oxo-dGTP pyrophosphatase MutT (NUDIX family)
MKLSKVVRPQSGVIPYRKRDDGISILLVLGKGGEWIIPKGGVEKGMTRKASAAKEAMEEAGVAGVVGPRLGSFVYNKKSQTQLVEVYPMLVTKVLNVYLESSTRRRKWFDAPIAVEILKTSSKPQLARHVSRLIDNLKV